MEASTPLLTKWLCKTFQTLLDQKWNREWEGKPFFKAIWHDGKIRFAGSSQVFDILDELSARLVCCNLFNRGQLLIILPDNEPRRPAALFATALTMSALASIQNGRVGGLVLYFGSTFGIRSQLSTVAISNLSLSSVFSQTYGKGTASEGIRSIPTIPSVLCVYSPLDPVALVERYSPKWVAIDCGIASSIQWLRPLLEYLLTRRIPLIAWSANPLSSITKEFLSLGAKIFKWPSLVVQPDLIGNNARIMHEALSFFTKAPKLTEIIPCFINGEAIQKISNSFHQSQKALAEGLAKKPDRLGRDALSVGWKYLRALERVPVPVDLFDQESAQYWGINSLERLRQAFEKLILAANFATLNITGELERAKYHLESVHDAFRKSGNPRWDALVTLCLEDIPKNHVRVLVFPNNALRIIFGFALLARFNTSENDLAEMGVRLLSFKDICAALEKNCLREICIKPSMKSEDIEGGIPLDTKIDFILVAMPSQALSARMSPFFNAQKLEILIYSHQIPLLSRLVSEWGEALGNDPLLVINTLSELASLGAPNTYCEKMSACRLGEGRTIIGSLSLQPKTAHVIKPIYEPLSELEEIALLLSNKDDDPTALEDVVLEEESERDSEEPLVDKALEVKFQEGWRGLFPLDAQVNIVRSTSRGDKVETGFVRSLRKGDRIIYIHGQKRQSLYELLLTRVHHHPSIEIHLVLIRQWQQEIRQAFINWEKSGRNIYDLFREMVKHGTLLETDVALRYWVRGWTMRPRDREDLRRVAGIMEMPFTLEHYQRIHAAGDRIHGLHVSLALRLNAWIQRGASVTEMTDDLIDADTGLTFGDVRDSLILLRVESLFEVSGPFERSRLSRIERS